MEGEDLLPCLIQKISTETIIHKVGKVSTNRWMFLKATKEKWSFNLRGVLSFLYQQMSLPLHRHEQPSLCNTSPQANRAHRETQSQPWGTARQRQWYHWDVAQGTYYHRWIDSALGLLGSSEDHLGGKKVCFVCVCFLSSGLRPLSRQL